MNATDAPYQFLGFDVSYFTAKVRPALRYKGLWVDERRADIGEIVKRTGLGFIPVVITPEGETWQDSTEIYDRLEERHPSPPLFPSTPVQRMVAHLIELYVDEFGVIPAMHYRWGIPLDAATTRARFGAMMGSAELGEKAGERMAAARVVLGATDETGPAIEAHTRDLLDALCALFESQPYLLGSRMSFADAALMGPLYAHLFNDLASRQLLLETALPVVGWIERCNYPNEDAQGEWLADDALAPALREVLRVMGLDATPLLLAMAETLDAALDGAHASPLPRGLGRCKAPLRDVVLERGVQTYTLWMIQRTLDAFGAFSDAEQGAILEAIGGSGFEPLLSLRPRHRLAKDGFELTRASQAQGDPR